MNFSKSRQRSGLILLVVLGMLAFLGVLLVTYISFTTRTRRTSYALASREFHKPNVDQLFEEAVMKLIRGTNDPSDPFFGEDLLSDLYGRRGRLNLTATDPARLTLGPDGNGPPAPPRRPIHVGGGFVRLPVDLDAIQNWDDNTTNDPDPRPAWSLIDDAFAGRVITFRAGPLRNRSFRVLRSTGARPAGPQYVHADAFFIELDPELVVTLGNGSTVQIDDLISPRAGGPAPSPHAVSGLFYTPRGGAYGTINDDDGDGNNNNPAEAGLPNSPTTTLIRSS